MRQVPQSQRQAYRSHSVKGSPKEKGDTAHHPPCTPVANSFKRLNGATGRNPHTQYSTRV